MKIKELELNNFRGFEHLKIQFPENNLAVFIGTNGSGKSSVLDALGMLLNQFVFHISKKSLVGVSSKPVIERTAQIAEYPYKLSYDDIRIGLKNFTLNWMTVSRGGIDNKRWSIAKSKDNTWIGDDSEAIQLVETFAINIQESLPVLIYYKTGRTIPQTVNAEDENGIALPQLYTYQNALNPSAKQFNDFIEWFKEITDYENAEMINRKSFDFKDMRLETVRHALGYFLNILVVDVYKNLHIQINDSPVFEFKPRGYTLAINKNGQDFSINQLSDGEKTLIMLVCDIARRLTIANPALENKLEGEGVVMIDEIELHLHPAWQRNVLPALQQTFPNIQFIVTTHSPQVLGGIERESLFILKDFQLQEYTPHTKGRDSNSILKEVQGVDERLPAYREKLDKLAKLLDDENVNEAEKLLAELKKDLGERDVEIAKIETIMHFFDD